MFTVAALALLVAMLLTLARLFMGPSLYDRTLAVNAIGTKPTFMASTCLCK